MIRPKPVLNCEIEPNEMSAAAIRNMYPIGTNILVLVDTAADPDKQYQEFGVVIGYAFDTFPDRRMIASRVETGMIMFDTCDEQTHLRRMIEVRLVDGRCLTVYPAQLEHNRSI